jgi:hypothetical protein
MKSKLILTMTEKKKLPLWILTAIIIVIIFFYFLITPGLHKFRMEATINQMEAGMGLKHIAALKGEQIQDDKDSEESIEKTLREDRKFIPKEAYDSIVDAYSVYQSMRSYMTLQEFEQRYDEYKKSINRAKSILGL